jgi:lipopolysaccharide transport system permease protein
VPVSNDAAVARTADSWVIEPQRRGVLARTAEFWHYRRVLWFLGSRAVKDRYEGTTLGIFWLFARPLIPILVTGLVFGRFLRIPSDGVPFVLFFMTGVVPWNLFERSILFGTRGLEQHRGLIKKLYFPRLIAPISSISPAIIDFVIYGLLITGTGLFYFAKDGVFYLRLGPTLLVALAMTLLAVFCALGIVFWTCIAQTKHRDVRLTMRYVLQFWMYLTPIFYPVSMVPPEYRWVVVINPIASIVATFRWALLGIGEVPAIPLAIAVGEALVACVLGIWYFTASESAAVDRL